MYLTFFGLHEKPFAITPDPRYLFLSARHAEALAHLLYGINEAGGFVQLTGEVGTGKTTIVRSLLAQTPKNAEIALILNPKMTAPEFLLTICEELGIGVPDSALGSLKDLVDILSHYLLRAHAAGHRVVLVVDEAQNLSPEVLEQVRLLTNLETNTQKLLQIILIGQPELRELLSRNELRQLAQRITGRYHLNPLSREETTAYVRHRLRVAGATTDIFSPGALTAVFRLSGGVPRVINVICDRALLGAYSLDRHRVTGALVRSAATEVFGRRLTPYWLPWAATVVVAVALTAVTVAVWNFQPWSARARLAAAAPADVPRAGDAGGASHPGELSAATHAEDASPVARAGDASAAVPPATALPPRSAAASLLAQWLVQHAAETDTDNAFAKLFGLWGAKYQPNGTDPCTQAAQQGLACVAERGSFGQLRLYNHPVILLLTDGAGASHQVVLTALDDEQARLDLGGAHSVGIGELSRYWLGDFVMLWRPAASPVKPLSAGMRGAQVRWLRQSLQRLHGAPGDAPVSDLFDAELTSWVRDFQRQHQLAVDGIAGVQTQIALASAVSGPDAPLLSAADAHHGG
jgi:general secretion pathway protein A